MGGANLNSTYMVEQCRIKFPKQFQFTRDLHVLDMNQKFDIVLGMPFLAAHNPQIDWVRRTMTLKSIHFHNGQEVVSERTVRQRPNSMAMTESYCDSMTAGAEIKRKSRRERAIAARRARRIAKLIDGGKPCSSELCSLSQEDRIRIEKQQQIDGQIAIICNSIAADLCMQFHQQYPSVNASVIENNKSQLISTIKRLTGNLWAQSYHKDIVDRCITHAVLRRCWTQVIGAAQVNSVQLDQGNPSTSQSGDIRVTSSHLDHSPKSGIQTTPDYIQFALTDGPVDEEY